MFAQSTVVEYLDHSEDVKYRVLEYKPSIQLADPFPLHIFMGQQTPKAEYYRSRDIAKKREKNE